MQSSAMIARPQNPLPACIAKQMTKQILTTTAILLSMSLAVQGQLLSEGFDAETSINGWAGEPAWSASAGNPGGAVIVSN